MSIAEPTGLQSFHRFIEKRLESDATADLSPEEALALWHEEQKTLEAIREGLADVDAGRTKSLEEFDRDFRQRHRI